MLIRAGAAEKPHNKALRLKEVAVRTRLPIRTTCLAPQLLIQGEASHSSPACAIRGGTYGQERAVRLVRRDPSLLGLQATFAVQHFRVMPRHNRANQVLGHRNNDEAQGKWRNSKANRGCRSDKRDEHLALRALFRS